MPRRLQRASTRLPEPRCALPEWRQPRTKGEGGGEEEEEEFEDGGGRGGGFLRPPAPPLPPGEGHAQSVSSDAITSAGLAAALLRARSAVSSIRAYASAQRSACSSDSSPPERGAMAGEVSNQSADAASFQMM